jgi:hypothetical protein
VVLKQLQTLILANKSSNWFVTFLAVFILLHNYELQCNFHRGFARRRKFEVSEIYRNPLDWCTLLILG